MDPLEDLKILEQGVFVVINDDYTDDYPTVDIVCVLGNEEQAKAFVEDMNRPRKDNMLAHYKTRLAEARIRKKLQETLTPEEWKLVSGSTDTEYWENIIEKEKKEPPIGPYRYMSFWVTSYEPR